MAKSETDKQAAQIAKDFSKNKMIGEVKRNRIGNKVWGTAAKGIGILKWTALGALVLGYAPVSVATISMLIAGHMAHSWAKGHVKYLQNLTLMNAFRLGRSMRNANIPDKVKKRAIEMFMKKESPWFTASQYIKKNPDSIEQMSRGLMPKFNQNFVSIWDKNVNSQEKGATLSDRFSTYKNSFKEWRTAVAEEKAEKAALKAAKNSGKNLAEAASEVSVKRALEEISQRPTHAPSQITQQATNQIAQQVGKTAVTETGEKAIASTAQTAVQKGASTVEKTGRLPLGKALVEKINLETMKKTGAKIATMTTLKLGAKKIPILGAVFGAAFAAGRAAKGDWTGAGMEFSSGVASCAPGIGTVASLGIDGALLAKDLAGRR